MNLKLYKNRIVATLTLLLIVNANYSQEPIQSQYQFNMLPINPAYAGARDMMSLMLQSRQQWVGFDGAPKTISFSSHTPITQEHIGLGLSITKDDVDPSSQTGFFIDYAYKFKIASTTTLALGLKAGFDHLDVNYSRLDNSVTGSDIAYEQGGYSKILPNFGFGIYLSNKRFFAGVAVPKLLETDLQSSSDENSSVNINQYRHYYAMTGGIFSISESIKLKPSLLARYATATPLSADVNLNTIYLDKLWLGAMYRISSAWGGMLQYQITSQLRFGYAFEMDITELQKHNNGTHEIMLNFEFYFKKNQVYNPRYF